MYDPLFSDLFTQENCTAICVAIKELKRDIYEYFMKNLSEKDREDYVKVRL